MRKYLVVNKMNNFKKVISSDFDCEKNLKEIKLKLKIRKKSLCLCYLFISCLYYFILLY